MDLRSLLAGIYHIPSTFTHAHAHMKNTYTQECMGLTGTHCSCISRVVAGTSKVVGVLATLCQITLCPSTIHTIIPGWTTASSEGSISKSFNCYWVAQLMTHNSSIKEVPVVITHCSPLAKEKDLKLIRYTVNTCYTLDVVSATVFSHLQRKRSAERACSSTSLTEKYIKLPNEAVECCLHSAADLTHYQMRGKFVYTKL